MNELVLLAGFLALAASGAAAWALIERGRAVRAEERARFLEANADAVQAQAAQSAEAVAGALVRRASEAFEAQERLAQVSSRRS